jgi:hypothetical protein
VNIAVDVEVISQPTSAILIRFVRDGREVDVDMFEPAIFADGVKCLFPRVPESSRRSTYSMGWPVPGFAPECGKGPPTTIRFEFTSELGLLTVELVWSGQDVSRDIQLAGASQLPITGGRPGDD